jgi:hypothetical protein
MRVGEAIDPNDLIPIARGLSRLRSRFSFGSCCTRRGHVPPLARPHELTFERWNALQNAAVQEA